MKMNIILPRVSGDSNELKMYSDLTRNESLELEDKEPLG